MSAVGGSMITIGGLETLVGTDTSTVPKYFKFSSQTDELNAEMTTNDITGWIQKDITTYNKVDEQTIEFVCDVLPGEAVEFTNLCGLYLEDGTLFMVAKPPHAFPSDLRQTFRIQLVYENAADIINFQYLDLSNTDVRFAQLEDDIDNQVQAASNRMDNIISTHETDSTVVENRLTTLEAKDTSTDNRIDILENTYTTSQSLQDTNITALQTNRQLDVQQVQDYISSNNATVAAIMPVVNTNKDESTARDLALGVRIDEVITNSDVGTIGVDLAALEVVVQDNFEDLTANILIGTQLTNNVNSTLTSVINTNASTSLTTDTALGARIDSLDTDYKLADNIIRSNISNIDALIISNKNSVDANILANTNAITSLQSNSTDQIETDLAALTEVVNNNNNTITQTVTNLNTSITSTQAAQDTIISLHTTAVDTTIPTEQEAQNIRMNTIISDQTTINNGFTQDINIIKSDLTSLPDQEEMQTLIDDVGDNTSFINDIYNGVLPVSKANTWTTARSITLTGDVTGTVTLDGSANVSFGTTIEVEVLPAGGSVGQLLTNTGPGTGTWQTIDASYLPLAGGILTGDLILTSTDTTTRLLQVGKSTNGSQGTGAIEVTQDGSHGGGMSYNGDNTPGFVNGEGSDETVFYRMSSGDRTKVFGYIHNSNNVDFDGSIYVAGDITANSDKTLKENIEIIPNALDKINLVNGVTFTRNDFEDKETRHTGIIAQELQEVLPEAVSIDNNGKLSIAYGNIVGLLIEGIKELRLEVHELKEINN